MQIWPWWKNEPKAAALTAASRSASSSTMTAELPPSSRWARLRCRAASSPTLRPAAVEPVKEMTRTRGSAISAWPVSAPPGSTCSRPSGRPASSNTRARLTPPHTAVRGSGLRITALPSASAGATERIERISGALNGAMTPTTPTGTRRARLRRFCSLGMISPSGLRGQRRGLVALLAGHVDLELRLRRDRARLAHDPADDVLGVLLDELPARRSTAARSRNGVAAHSRWASAARSAERATSSASAIPIRPSSCPVAGSTTAASPPDAARQPPSKIDPDHAAGLEQGRLFQGAHVLLLLWCGDADPTPARRNGLTVRRAPRRAAARHARRTPSRPACRRRRARP